MTSPDSSGTEGGTEVSYREDAGVATIAIERPRRRNALTPETADQLVGAFERADADPEVGAIVVMGAGGHFCAGADRDSLASVREDPLAPTAMRDIERIYAAFTRISSLRIPVLAAVRGAAVGAGVNLAMAADVRIVADDSRFAAGFAALGLHPGGGHFHLLARAAAPEVALAVGLLGESLDGRRAAELGLAWQSVPDAQVEDVATELAGRLGRDPELARRATPVFRATTAPPSSWEIAVHAERAPQLWSQSRASREQ